MIFETLITSAQRGIRPGRTGFQPVMQTTALREDILRQLEPFAAYRHVHQQGSGNNPECFSFRRLRTNIGELFVLIRTVDAGNDYSNRSNKCSHILAITADEVGRFFNSTPANILSDNPSLFLSNWMGGPESRAVAPQLMSLPHRPAPCVQWQSCFGDAALGGVVAQRIRERKPTLVVAQDSTPQSSQMLLKLFAEASALLNQAERWDATFETTILGKSQSLLQGTYKQSAESEIQQTGMLRLEIGVPQQVPADLVNTALCILARDGETTQSVPSQQATPRPQPGADQARQKSTSPAAPPKPPPQPGAAVSPKGFPGFDATPEMPKAGPQVPAQTTPRQRMSVPASPINEKPSKWKNAAIFVVPPLALALLIGGLFLVQGPVKKWWNEFRENLNSSKVAKNTDSDTTKDKKKETTPPTTKDKKKETTPPTTKDKKEETTPPTTPLTSVIAEIKNQKISGDNTWKEIVIASGIKGLDTVGKEISFNFVRVEVNGNFNQLVKTSDKACTINGTKIGEFEYKNETGRIVFTSMGEQSPLDRLHFFIPITIKAEGVEEKVTFSLVERLSPEKKAELLAYNWEAAKGESSSLRQLLEPGKISLAIGLQKFERKALSEVAPEITLFSTEPVVPAKEVLPDGTEIKASIEDNKLQFILSYNKKKVIRPVNVKLVSGFNGKQGEITIDPDIEKSWFKRKDRFFEDGKKDFVVNRMPSYDDLIKLYQNIKEEAVDQFKAKKENEPDGNNYLIDFEKSEKKLQELVGLGKDRNKPWWQTYLFFDFFNQHSFDQEFVRPIDKPDTWFELDRSKELGTDNQIIDSITKRFGKPWGTANFKNPKNPDKPPLKSFPIIFINKKKDTFKTLCDQLFDPDPDERLVGGIDDTDEGARRLPSWHKVLRQHLVRSYWYFEVGIPNDQNKRLRKDGYDILFPKSEDDKSEDDGKKRKKIRDKWVEESNDQTKRLKFYEDLLGRTQIPQGTDRNILFNLYSGVLAGKILQELNPTYMCSLANKVLTPGKTDSPFNKHLDEVLSADIKIKVDKTPSKIMIGRISPRPPAEQHKPPAEQPKPPDEQSKPPAEQPQEDN